MIEQAILVGLSAWRLTALVSYERGPFDIFLKFRSFIGFEHSDLGEPTSWPSNFLTEMIACPWCLGIWGAGAMYGLWILEPLAVMVVAASAIVIAVEKWNHR